VALVVIGPERLPKVARTAGLLLGRLQRYVSDVKSDINREMQLDELKKLQQQMTDQVTEPGSFGGRTEMREVEASVNNCRRAAGPKSPWSPAPTFEGHPGRCCAAVETLVARWRRPPRHWKS